MSGMGKCNFSTAVRFDAAPATVARTAPTETTVAVPAPAVASDTVPHMTHGPAASSDAAAAAPHYVVGEGRVESQERKLRRPVPPPRPRASVPPPPPPRARGAGSRSPVPAPAIPAGVSPAEAASPWDDVLQSVQGAPGDGRGRD